MALMVMHNYIKSCSVEPSAYMSVTTAVLGESVNNEDYCFGSVDGPFLVVDPKTFTV